MTPETPAIWAARLRSIAEPVLRGTPLVDDKKSDPQQFVETFRDERGHHRAVDVPLLSRLLKLSPRAPATMTPDVAVWWALIRPDRSLLHDLSKGAGPLLSGTPRDLSDPSSSWGAIEVWTESELSALHALSHHAALDPSLAARIDSAADWLITSVQPDNATNHPWAIHVFLSRWLRTGDHASRMYASTLLHNAQVSLGRPDRFSAAILLDAASALSPEV